MFSENPETVSQTVNIMSIFIPYLIGMIITFVAFTAINHKVRWICRDDFDGGMGLLLFMAIMLWPLSVVIGIFVGISRIFIPD